MFQDLRYTSPTYQVDGIGTFRFTCRYPNEDEVLSYFVDVEQIVEAHPSDDSPKATKKDAAKRTEARKLIAEAVQKHTIQLIEKLEYIGDHKHDWRAGLTAEDRPGFLGAMLQAVGFHLFRGATEQSDQEPD